MSNDLANSVLAALAGMKDQQETLIGSGERFPAIRWRSGSVDARNMVKMLGNAAIPDDVYLALNGYWFIAEDDVPADDEGAQVEMKGFVPYTYTNVNNKEVTGFAAPTITFDIIGMRQAHFAEDGRHFMAWDQGWNEGAYDKGYTRKRLQTRIILDGIPDYEFTLDLQGAKQYDFLGGPKHPGVVYTVEKEYLPLIAKELGIGSGTLPLMVAKVEVGPHCDEQGQVIFTASTYTEDGVEKQGMATTTFAVIPPNSIADMIASADEIANMVERRNELAEWLAEWDESKLAPITPAAKKEEAKEAPTAEGL